MIVSSLRIRDFGDGRSKEIIGGLTRAFSEVEPDPPRGFLHSMLLRPEDGSGDAVFMTLWQSQADLGRFMATERGAAFAKKMAKLVGGDKDGRNHYFVTWQSAIYQPAPAQACGCKKDGRINQ